MSPQKHQKHSRKPAQTDAELMIADVPVLIHISHGEEVLQEYEDVIDLEFTTQTPEGRANMGKMYELQVKQGLSTESALFTIASEAVRETAEELASSPIVTSKVGQQSPHELHVHVKRNGTITFRKLAAEEA
jgi:hypothetical protein